MRNAPVTMIFLREALDNASISYNKAGELVQQAQYLRRRGGVFEQFFVMKREGSVTYFHLVWKEMDDGEGDWTASNALSCSDLDELYSIASHEIRQILDAMRWDPL